MGTNQSQSNPNCFHTKTRCQTTHTDLCHVSDPHQLTQLHNQTIQYHTIPPPPSPSPSTLSSRHHHDHDTHHEEMTSSHDATCPLTPPYMQPFTLPLLTLSSTQTISLSLPFFLVTMSDQSKPMSQMLYESAVPSSRQTVKFLTAATIGAALLVLSGLTLSGTVIALILVTPVLVLFSPIIVPAGIVIFLAITGFLFSGGCGVAAITALSWIYNYVSGKHPPGADQLDYAREKIANKAWDMKERAKEYGQYVQ